jgi:ssDNA-binding Zn-finger/Zn-ribbon topoisomerase 1
MRYDSKFKCPDCGEPLILSIFEDDSVYICLNPKCEGTFELEELE